MKHRFISKRYWNSITTPMAESSELGNKYDDIINLTLGDPDLTTDRRIIEAAFADAMDGHTHYTDSYGYPELRDAICAFYRTEFDYDVTRNNCMVTTSGSHALWLIWEAILDDGDEVIIHAPYFVPYPQQIELARGNPVVLDTTEENGFQVDASQLEKLITNRTKAVIINTPNNPTGACFSRETLTEIAAVAKKHDLVIVADDTYGSFSYDEPFVPLTTLDSMHERTITVGSFSKDYSMTGWRIGYALAPDFIIRTMKDINENNVFTAPSISQRAALHALKLRNVVQPPIVEEYKKRIFYAYERIRSINNMSVLPPGGGLYLFVNIKDTGFTSAEVADKMYKEAGVLMIPGGAFGDCGEGYLRLAVTVGVSELGEAFDRIAKMPIFS